VVRGKKKDEFLVLTGGEGRYRVNRRRKKGRVRESQRENVHYGAKLGGISAKEREGSSGTAGLKGRRSEMGGGFQSKGL